ncbi:magnesium/cobalt transporter CorA [Emcibacter sp.]|uniref:magnesium/cobalt transporter CorA n=1 Tax=Emcibacter sp. TaxID=1979954 RepID=UPI002AA8B26C|nr:magnesium/cobalt transporter CorA [Emcibacter sp.]
MLRIKRHHEQAGTAPGTLRAPDRKQVENVTIEVIRYNQDEFEVLTLERIEDCFNCRTPGHVTWLNINGLHDLEMIRKIGDHFGLHVLALEDLLNLGQRPKMEQYDDHLFAVFKMIKKESPEQAEQVSMFIAENLVITFQEMEGDVFEPVRQRLRTGKNKIRKCGADYLAYALLDQAVDELYPVLERYSEKIDNLEEQLMDKPRREHLESAHKLKRELLALKRIIWPERELVNALMRSDLDLVTEDTKIYLRDVYDHTIQLVDVTETYRDMTMDLVDLYLSSISNSMNEVMKVLTVIATIFIPITFIAGLYGMNFNPQVSPWNMPELNWAWGYPFALGLMAAVVALMLYYFKRKNWL